MFSRISHIAKFTGFIGMVALSLLSVSSCDNIYDDLSEIPSNNDKENCYTNVDATSYTTWVYLNFADGSQTSLPYDNTADIPADWTIALHRYDIKTNSGSAFRTGYTSLDEVKTAAKTGTFPMPDASEFTRDEPSKITIDRSHRLRAPPRPRTMRWTAMCILFAQKATTCMPSGSRATPTHTKVTRRVTFRLNMIG